MVQFFNPGNNREFFGNRAQWNPIRTNGNQFYGGPSQVGGGMGGGPSMTNWQPPMRGNYPGVEGPAGQPPLGGPLPPMGGGNTASGGPSQPGSGWMDGGSPGGERPGTYGVPNDFRMGGGGGRPPGFLGNPGIGGNPGFGGGNAAVGRPQPGGQWPRFGGGRPPARGL